ncbi:hypothetical protein B296_00021842 [Ensete ventricosum]|uniref:Uncharacterized protein n=1 Tax=Ensete ventricosum TaxID=4639 RepID=A0A426ZGA3_ENSVE|nr:hypothetical protein B296_00021842 [Ensete ventricosum]
MWVDYRISIVHLFELCRLSNKLHLMEEDEGPEVSSTGIKGDHLVHNQSPDFHSARPPLELDTSSPSKQPTAARVANGADGEVVAAAGAAPVPRSDVRATEAIKGLPTAEAAMVREVSLLDLNSPQFWHELRRLKLKCWHDLQFQSPGHLLIYSSPVALKELLTICASRNAHYELKDPSKQFLNDANELYQTMSSLYVAAAECVG